MTFVAWLTDQRDIAARGKDAAAAAGSSLFGAWQARELAFAEVLATLGADDGCRQGSEG